MQLDSRCRSFHDIAPHHDAVLPGTGRATAHPRLKPPLNLQLHPKDPSCES